MAESCNQTSDQRQFAVDPLTAIFESATNRFVVPLELAVGFACQICNLLVLHSSKIKTLAYTTYLKALSINYIVNILFLVPSLMRKNGMIDRRSYLVMFYHAHLEQYCANLFLISGNLIIVATAAEALRAVLFPLRTLTMTNRRRRQFFVLAIIYAWAALILLPTTVIMRLHVEPIDRNRSANFEIDNSDQNWRYCSKHVKAEWIGTLRYVLAAVFEVFLILLVLLIYTCVLIKFRSIVRQHRHCVRQLTQTPNTRLLSSSHRKATVICLASVTAFLICNMPSAALETIYLISYVRHDLREFWRSETRSFLRDTVNIMLVFNFSLTFVLQYAVSLQYRRQFHRLIRQGKLSTAKKFSWSSTQQRNRNRNDDNHKKNENLNHRFVHYHYHYNFPRYQYRNAVPKRAAVGGAGGGSTSQERNV